MWTLILQLPIGQVRMLREGLTLGQVLPVRRTGLAPSSRSSISPFCNIRPLRRRHWQFSAQPRQDPCPACPTGRSPPPILQTPSPPCVKANEDARIPGICIGCVRLDRHRECAIIRSFADQDLTHPEIGGILDSRKSASIGTGTIRQDIHRVASRIHLSAQI